MTDTTALTIAAEPQEGLARYQPANLKQLVWFAGEVAKSGMYLKTDGQGNQVAMTQAETFMVMSEGIEMGISPLTAMRNIYFMEDKRGRKTTIPRADLIAARIQADPRTEEWDVDDTVPGTVTVSAKRRGRAPVSMTLTLADIPSRDKERWAKGYLDAQEMLVNRTVRRIARRHFKDMVLGLGVDQDYDETKVIDVAKVEAVVGPSTPPCHLCGGRTRLIPSNNGGVFLTCDNGHNASPPQAVRDAVRGTPEALTLAGPVLEAGERLPEPGELPADIIDAEPVTLADPADEAGPQEQPSVEASPPAAPIGVRDDGSAPVGGALPLTEEQDTAFMEAAGIAPETPQPEPQPMDRTEVEAAVQAILRAITHARAVGTLEAARTILRAHGWDDTPLSSWLMRHPAELPGLVTDLA